MGTTYEIGPFRLDVAAKAVTRAGAPVALGPRAVAVLASLVQSAPEYVPKTQLMDEAWPGVFVEEANLHVQISAIRRVFAEGVGREDWIETLARRGYRFVGPVAKLPDNPPGDAGGTSARSNLPEPLTSFVNRERELAELQDLLARQRLLTLVGSGGVGKTRLALRVAGAVMDRYSDGVRWIELAALADPALVSQAVSTVLGLAAPRNKSLTESLIEFLKPKRLLLVLDNAEHLLEGCAHLADAVLRQCPQVTLLVTSRERLGIDGELTYRVPSLSMPDAERDATAQSLARYEAVRLFSERVRLHRPHFHVTDENAPAVAGICRRLDGIPLAIELAAARVRSMSVEEVNQRLEHSFRLLSVGSPTVLPRHQTLRALIDWSYDLLSETEQALFIRLSVFAGGWTLEAAESVCSDKRIDKEAVLDLLASLADKSLAIVEERNGASRYKLLETVRQYGRDRLRESGEEADTRDRHLAYFLALAERAEPLLLGADQQAWLERLETEHDNLRHALEWALANGDAVAGLRLAGSLRWFWQVRGVQVEGSRWLSRLLAATSDTQAPAARAKALRGAGELARQQGDFQRAETLLRESLAVHRQLGDERGISLTLGSLASLLYGWGRYASARAMAEESLAILRRLGDAVNVAARLNILGVVALEQGDYAVARAQCEESLAIYRSLGNRWGISHQLDSLGLIAFNEGDYPTARALLEESLAIARDLGDRRMISISLNDLGRVASAQGDHRGALALLGEAIVLQRELGDRAGIATSLETFACSALGAGASGRAARLWGRAERQREEIGVPMLASERVRYDRDVAAARAAMHDDSAFDRAWQGGRATTLEQTIEYALNGAGV